MAICGVVAYMICRVRYCRFCRRDALKAVKEQWAPRQSVWDFTFFRVTQYGVRLLELEWNHVILAVSFTEAAFVLGVVLAMFFKRLRSRIKKDIRVIFERDPAARSVVEVVCCYSGLHAIWLHRISHKLYLKGWVLIPRMISNLGRFLTGIEIHPGATIGEGLFIDHGTGIVIGETAELGRNVTLYQGVTLGGTGKEKGKRHPTIGNNVVVASGAKVLGSFTVGDHAKIGAGSVVLKAVPAYATVVGIPGRVVVMHGKRVGEPVYTDEMMKLLDNDVDSDEMVEEQDVDLNHDELPDPVRDLMLEMSQRLEKMEARIEELEKELEEKNA